ncbi:unnamed protein product [Caenorhabditis auriculariae]|uniref:Uncharacterized protein n=1 Tax=Caenorhabditis auriculariae TaxID=2777116 RepID=A0A8S1H4I9_9PELO|nr:unnamed protein product [Caenorhabditis auriculariae]
MGGGAAFPTTSLPKYIFPALPALISGGVRFGLQRPPADIVAIGRAVDAKSPPTPQRVGVNKAFWKVLKIDSRVFLRV